MITGIRGLVRLSTFFFDFQPSPMFSKYKFFLVSLNLSLVVMSLSPLASQMDYTLILRGEIPR